MANEEFVDAFADVLNDHVSLARIVKAVFSAVSTTLQEKKKELTSSIASALNIPDEFNSDFEPQYLSKIYQDFSLHTFSFKDEYYQQLLKKLSTDINEQHESQAISAWLKCPELKCFLERVHKLYLHMTLSDPAVELNFEHEVSYKKFSKALHHCVDGFPKEGLECVIVIPAPMRGEHAYQGIKSSVVITQGCSKECITAVDGKESPIVETTGIVKRNKSASNEQSKEPFKETSRSILKFPSQDTQDCANLKAAADSERSRLKVSWHSRSKAAEGKSELLSKCLMFSKKFLQRQSESRRNVLARVSTEKHVGLMDSTVVGKGRENLGEGSSTSRSYCKKAGGERKRLKGTKTPGRANAELYDKRTRDLRAQLVQAKAKRRSRENQQININSSTMKAGTMRLKYIHKAKENLNLLQEKTLTQRDTSYI